MSLYPKSDFILDNIFIFLGIGVLMAGVIVALSYEFNEEAQTAKNELMETDYIGMITIIDSLIVSGYWVMIFGGLGLSILGYSLKVLLK